MKITIIKLCSVLVIMALIPSLSQAKEHSHHHGHRHYANKSKIEENAKLQLKLLVEHDKIDKTWVSASILDVQEKMFGKFTEWVVRFENDKIKDKSKKTLYMFLNLKGKVLGANYTGN